MSHPVPWRWRITYEDGTTFSNLDGEPNDSPKWGVVCIAQPDALGRDLLWNEPFYIFRTDEGEWSKHDLIGFVDQHVHFDPMISCSRSGRDTLTSRFKRLVEEVGREMRGR